MGWLERLFGMEKPQGAQVNPQPAPSAPAPEASGSSETIAPERVGLNGEYDQSGLAKRVALAFDEEPQMDDINTLWVAQLGSTVVLKGEVPNQAVLDQAVNIARGVSGATDVKTDEVTITSS